MFLANKLNKGGSLSSPDAQFNYVTMLLHGDGTNGAQNNTFVDSSTNNFTITRNGNTTQGSFSPYGSNWSNYFDGSGDYLSVASNSALQFGTGDFTFECWVYRSSASGQIFIADFGASSVSGWGLYDEGSGGNMQFRIGDVDRIAVSPLTAGAWSHVAVVRSGTTATLYVNGTSAGSYGSASTNLTYSGTNYIGSQSGSSSYINGYMSNVRAVKGTAVYTSNFTPSTTPLTAISGTSLLTCQSNRFIDNSTNNFTVTVAGNTSVQRFNPFGASTAYSTSVIGGSGYFDGSGDNLVVSGTGSFNPRSTFTVEFWTYPITNYTINWINSNTDDNFYIETFEGTLYVGDGSINTISATPPSLNRWTHVLLSFDGTTYRLFYNGVSQATSTSLLASNTITAFRIGQKNDTSRPFNGYINDLRVLVGTALQTSTFTPPTAPLTAITNTTVLLKFQNAAIYDNAMMNDLETVGNAQISTSVKKYGTGSLAFDGTGDWLTSYATLSKEFGAGAFTIECWAYITDNSTRKYIIGAGTDTATHYNFALELGDTGKVQMWASSNGTNWNLVTSDTSEGKGTDTIPLNQWNHIAMVRESSGTFKSYLNGVLQCTVSGKTAAIVSQPTVPFNVGKSAYQGSFGNFNGYIDDLRITKGYARYTATFTPPTKALSDTGPI